MQLKEVKEELNKFGQFVIQQARSRLTKGDKNVNKKLYNSLEYKPFNRGGSIGVEFYMEQYGKFQDQGVPQAFADFVKRKGIKGRDKKTGRFITNESLQYLIARSVFNKGIRASMFFTKPFNQAYEKLPPKLQKSFVKDIEKIIFNNG